MNKSELKFFIDTILGHTVLALRKFETVSYLVYLRKIVLYFEMPDFGSPLQVLFWYLEYFCIS